jgi:ketosteroid isomerase-like protein
MSEQTSVRLIRDIYLAFSRGDIAGVLNLCDLESGFELEGPASIPWVGNWQGREGWAKFFQALGENADEITLQKEPFAAQGDNDVIEGRNHSHVKQKAKRIDSPLVH